jgi:hypothetical protein
MSDPALQAPEMFEPYERLIEIVIGDQRYSVPENNSILRCLQFLDMEKISHADLCWNGDCLNCSATIVNGGKEKSVMACRTNAYPGMRIVRLNAEIDIT